MYATIPVYYPSLEEAARKDEAALWCDSYNINMSCRNFIQDKAPFSLFFIRLIATAIRSGYASVGLDGEYPV